jgi:hypothetical protein
LISPVKCGSNGCDSLDKSILTPSDIGLIFNNDTLSILFNPLTISLVSSEKTTLAVWSTLFIDTIHPIVPSLD